MPQISPEFRAAGIIGTWDTDVPAGRSILDEGAAELLAGDVGLAGQPLPLEIALQRTHPEDRGWVFERIRRARKTGGPISAEFRILTETGDIRWILNRGNLAPDKTGAMHGYGAYIDTTDSHQSPFLPAHQIGMNEAEPLIMAADRCIEAHTAVARTGNRRLLRLSDLLLLEVGRMLAGRMHI